jgi:hypothetical protein
LHQDSQYLFAFECEDPLQEKDNSICGQYCPRDSKIAFTLIERASEVAKALLKEIIPGFGPPQTLQTDNGPAFISQVT